MIERSEIDPKQLDQYTRLVDSLQRILDPSMQLWDVPYLDDGGHERFAELVSVFSQGLEVLNDKDLGVRVRYVAAMLPWSDTESLASSLVFILGDNRLTVPTMRGLLRVPHGETTVNDYQNVLRLVWSGSTLKAAAAAAGMPLRNAERFASWLGLVKAREQQLVSAATDARLVLGHSQDRFAEDHPELTTAEVKRFWSKAGQVQRELAL